MAQNKRFYVLSWGVMLYLIAVILWGAWVRISGAGAGCGAHWPTCHGELIPISPSIETLIEYTHRLSSGMSLPLVLVLIYFAFKGYPKGHGVRWASVGVLIFLISESLVGAGLVKFELVAGDTSLARAITATLHLINTFTLSAFSALVVWWAKFEYQQPNLRSASSKVLIPGLGVILLVCMMGAVTALGDTLFPTSIFTERGLIPKLVEDISGSTHFLVQLRIIHPILAVLSALYLAWAVHYVNRKKESVWGLYVWGMLASQMFLGLMNILLGAPGWLQIIHLLVALLLWLGTIALFLTVHHDESTAHT